MKEELLLKKAYDSLKYVKEGDPISDDDDEEMNNKENDLKFSDLHFIVEEKHEEEEKEKTGEQLQQKQ